MLDFSAPLRTQPKIHSTSTVKDCQLGSYTEIGDRCVLEETVLGDYSYCFDGNDVIYAQLGKFNSISAGARINPLQHLR